MVARSLERSPTEQEARAVLNTPAGRGTNMNSTIIIQTLCCKQPSQFIDPLPASTLTSHPDCNCVRIFLY